jgi:DNA replication and repair protein RecF
MWLKHLEADRLRNLSAVSLDLTGGLTVVAGRNGQGKTSLLESIYLLATGRSFRTHRNDELIQREGGPLRVGARLEHRLGVTELGVVMERGVRRLLLDGTEADLPAYLGRFDLIALGSERMKVLRGGPDERRRFLDRGIVGLDPAFLRKLGEYRRLLSQRNALLKSSRGGDGREIDAWDHRLAVSAAGIHRRRREYAVTLASRLGEAERVLFPDGNELRLRYEPSPSGSGEVDQELYETLLGKALERHRDRDLAFGFTGDGPHRDDFVAELDGVDLRRFGSSGQIRAAVVALKLAKLLLLADRRGETPVFLMDDFDSDLDEVRTATLASYLDQGRFQALVAVSKVAVADQLGVPFRRVRMEAGRACEG